MSKKFLKIEGDTLSRHLKNFREKNENRKMRISSHSYSVKKLERGDPLCFLKLQFAVKYQKIERGPYGDKKISKKSRTVQNKPKGGTL